MSPNLSSQKSDSKAWTKKRKVLTDSFCDHLQAADKQQRFWDSRCPGLFINVTPRGVKSFVFCSTANGRVVWVTLGRFAVLERKGQPTLNVAAARRRADALRQVATDGNDVRAKVLGDRTPRSMEDLVELYRANYLPKLKPSTQDSVESLLDCHVLPKLGKRLVPDLGYGDMNQIHSDLVNSGKKVTANRVRSLLSRLLNIAAKEEWTQKGFNPVSMVERAQEVPLDRILKPKELVNLRNTLQAFRTNGTMDPSILEAVYFCAFSGLRRSEVLRLEWSDVDEKGKTITIRDHKRSASIGAMVLPLNSHMAEVIKRRKLDIQRDMALAEKEGETYTKPPIIFASARTGKALGGFSTSWQRIIKTAKIIGSTPHDLRRTFSTTCMELGNAPAIADLLLGHSLGKIRDTYNVLGAGGILAEASQKTSNRIAEWMSSPKVSTKKSKKN